jgi:hypothetical protein
MRRSVTVREEARGRHLRFVSAFDDAYILAQMRKKDLSLNAASDQASTGTALFRYRQSFLSRCYHIL